jgi:ABC-type branched-subunit amino acid transport system ATPase component
MKLSVRSVGVRFGAVVALNDVKLEVASGERRALIGPNGAGKTTLFNVISGDLRPQRGSVSLDDRDVTRLSLWRRARLGLGRTFQRSTLFPGLSVAENLSLAVRRRLGGDWRLWSSPSDRRVRAEVERRLEAAGLGAVAGRRAGAIGHGEQRALEIELVLAAEPQLVLLDEPMAGLSGGERQAAVERLRSLPAGVTLVIVEHDLDAVFALAGRITVLNYGVVIADGEPDSVRADARVQEVYLGV